MSEAASGRPRGVRMARWEARGLVVWDGSRPLVMGIVNATPDSFSDGGLAYRAEDAVSRGLALVAAGADLLDIGGESTRPGSDPVEVEEELRRVVPVVEALARRVSVPISVDSTKAEVARRSIEAGAAIVNDISALRGDPDLAAVIAEAGAGLVLMHMAGTPRTMQLDPRYDDVTAEVLEFLLERIDYAESQGIPRHRIAVDPGIGFGKTVDHNLQLLRNLGRFATLGCTILVGTSRKRFLGTLTGREVSDRVVGTVVSSLQAIRRGAGVVRVHDVGPMADAMKVWAALEPPGDAGT